MAPARKAAASPPDPAGLDELLALRERRVALASWLERLERERPRLQPVVYERVRADYAGRSAALEAEIAPLEDVALRDWTAVEQALGRLDAELEAAGLEKEELEVRVQVGELDAAKVAPRLAELAQTLGRGGEERRELLARRGRLERLRASAGADPGGTVVVPGGAAAVGAAAVGAAAVGAAAVGDVAVDSAAAGAVAVDAAAGDGGATVLIPPRPEPAATEPVAERAAAVVAAADVTAADVAATRMLRMATLVPESPLGGEKELRLEPLTTLGRTPANSIQLDVPSVSRRHAEITLGADGGYSVRDLGSENGTFVNGEKVVEARRLADGDRLLVGTMAFVFRLGG